MPAVYRIMKQPGFQSLIPADESEYQRQHAKGAWAFSGHKYHTKRDRIALRTTGLGKAPDVWTFRNTMLLEEKACQTLGLFVEQSGDYETLSFERRVLYLVHVSYALNCLDRERSEFVDSNGKPTKYVFHVDRLDWSLFKIPETHETEILTVEGLASAEAEFKPVYESNGLTGLRFEELYRWEK